jgi:multisubunit Na+/H+ antiporter MnhF subunit
MKISVTEFLFCIFLAMAATYLACAIIVRWGDMPGRVVGLGCLGILFCVCFIVYTSAKSLP